MKEKKDQIEEENKEADNQLQILVSSFIFA